MRRAIAALITSTALFAGGALVAAPTASAATPQADWWNYTWYTTDSHKGGTVYIRKNDDIVDLCDTYADGLAPRVDVSWDVNIVTRQHYNLTASGGYGSCVEATATNGYDIPEGKTVYVTIGLGPDYDNSSSHTYTNNG